MATFPCPVCAAPLVNNDAGATIYCPNCTNTVIIPADARAAYDPFAASPLTPVKPLWLDEVRKELARGNKILAIKLYRENTGLGLKESKDAVDEMERNPSLGGVAQLVPPPQAPSGSGCFSLLLVGAITTIWLFFYVR